MSRTSDNTLGELEEVTREAGFDYPIAWALSFLIDHQKQIALGLPKDLKKTLAKLCHEIRVGN